MSSSEGSWDKSEDELGAARSGNSPMSKVTNVPPKAKLKEFKIPKNLATPQDDPALERERIKELQELRDAKMGNQFFSDDQDDDDFDDAPGEKARAKLLLQQKIPTTPPRKEDTIRLDRLVDMEDFCDQLRPKIYQSPAKSGCWLQFMSRLFDMCASKMSPLDLKTFKNRVQKADSERQREKRIQMTSSKKGTDLKPNLKNPKEELDIMMGRIADPFSISGSESDDDEEEWMRTYNETQ